MQHTFSVRGVRYHLFVLDEPGFDPDDPTAMVYRDREDEPIATVHLNPACRCRDDRHVVAPPIPKED